MDSGQARCGCVPAKHPGKISRIPQSLQGTHLDMGLCMDSGVNWRRFTPSRMDFQSEFVSSKKWCTSPQDKWLASAQRPLQCDTSALPVEPLKSQRCCMVPLADVFAVACPGLRCAVPISQPQDSMFASNRVDPRQRRLTDSQP